jgi:hypothetical protein
MTSIPFILHYQLSTYSLTSFNFVLSSFQDLIFLAENLNPPGPYILGLREYTF